MGNTPEYKKFSSEMTLKGLKYIYIYICIFIYLLKEEGAWAPQGKAAAKGEKIN